MADLRGQKLKDSYQNVVTRGTGNKLENGNGVEFADLDDKASLSMFEEGEHTVTLTPITSGSITLRSDINTMYWDRTGDLVHVQGMIQVDSVSSPEGSLILMSLPFVIAEKTDASGRIGGSIVSGVDDLAVFLTIDGESQIRIRKDASTQQTGLSGRYYFSFSYIKA